MELPVAALLRPLVAEHRAHRVQLGRRQRVLEAVLDEGAHHARRRFRPQRDALAALVGEAVHLLLDDVGGFAGALGEQLLALDDRRADLDVAVALAQRARDALDVLPLLDLARAGCRACRESPESSADLLGSRAHVVAAGSARSSSAYSRIDATSASVSARRTFAGLPMTSDRGGIDHALGARASRRRRSSPRPIVGAVQQHRAHADQHAIADRAAVHDRAVADRHVVADDASDACRASRARSCRPARWSAGRCGCCSRRRE